MKDEQDDQRKGPEWGAYTKWKHAVRVASDENLVQNIKDSAATLSLLLAEAAKRQLRTDVVVGTREHTSVSGKFEYEHPEVTVRVWRPL